MADLDLTAAIQAGADALDEALGRANISTSSTTLAEAAVRAAAALIERAALERAAAEAEKCLRCGKPHEYRQVDAYRHSWADPDDGHTYARTKSEPIADWLRELAGGAA